MDLLVMTIITNYQHHPTCVQPPEGLLSRERQHKWMIKTWTSINHVRMVRVSRDWPAAVAGRRSPWPPRRSISPPDTLAPDCLSSIPQTGSLPDDCDAGKRWPQVCSQTALLYIKIQNKNKKLWLPEVYLHSLNEDVRCDWKLRKLVSGPCGVIHWVCCLVWPLEGL